MTTQAGTRFAGKTVVVTGASSGIGKATATAFLAGGAGVVAVADRAGELEQTAAELSGQGTVTPVVCDVADPEQVAALAEQTAALGGADVLVNNAGVWNERGFSELAYENWQRIIQVNLTGPFLCSQALVPQLAAKAPSAIVNTASTNGLVAEPRLAHYNASKGGLVMLTKSMAIDLAPLGIRVNAVAPGVIRTPLIEHLLAQDSVDHFGSIPAGRVGQPEEIAACIAFLASDEASYCHGTVLVCDGGQLAINGELPSPAAGGVGPAR